ncbi:hypothetical protein QJQ45_013455 [Haematococcus lacustris]|nr:hypothetical protein QJQ45_013455 [Haematococcus lacustris]
MPQDLKPDNVLLQNSPAGVVAKVADLGLSVVLGRHQTHISNARAGTVLYMAPEVLQGHCSQAGDVYSFGVMAWELLHGCTAWTRLQQITQEPRYLQGFKPHPQLFDHDWRCQPAGPAVAPVQPVLRGLRDLVDCCLLPRPSARPSFEQLIHWLAILVEVHGSVMHNTSQGAMKGKKRKGADEPKQPKPKGKLASTCMKITNPMLGHPDPVSPRGKALKNKLQERFQCVKFFLKGFISEVSGWKHLMRGPAHKQMAVNTREMFANPEPYVKLWAKGARSKYGITSEVSNLFVRVVCKYSLNSSSSELRGTVLEDPEWQAQMAFHRHVLTGVPVQERYFKELEEEAADVSQQQWGTRKQLVVFFGNAGIGTRGGWGAKAVLQACRKVVERPNSGKPTDRVQGKVVTVDEFRTSRVSSAMHSPQPCEAGLGRSKPTRPDDWKPEPGQVQHRLLRSAWSKRLEAPVRGLMWCPELDQATPGELGKWVDRDCNAALNLQRAGESKWRPLELCRWKDRGTAPAEGKEHPGLGSKKLRDRAPAADRAPSPAACCTGHVYERSASWAMPHDAQRHVDVAYITQALLQLRNQRFPVVDLRTYDRFRVERLSGPLVSIPRDGWQQQQQQEQCPAMEPWQQHQLANGQGQQHKQGHGQPGQQQEQGLQQQSRQVQELGQHEQEERQQPGLNQASGYAAGPNQAPGCADKLEFQLPAPCLQASLPSAPAPSREQVVVELVWSVVGLDSWHLSINSASGALEPLPLPDSCRGGGEEVAPAVNTHISGQAPETLGHCCWDLILCVRFLERVFLPRLPGLLAPGGFLLFSTFLDLPGTRRFGRPKGERHLLQRSELRELFEGVHKMQVLRDDVEVSADGRELSMFLARKADT